MFNASRRASMAVWRSLIATPPAPAGQPRTRGGRSCGFSCRGLPRPHAAGAVQAALLAQLILEDGRHPLDAVTVVLLRRGSATGLAHPLTVGRVDVHVV